MVNLHRVTHLLVSGKVLEPDLCTKKVTRIPYAAIYFLITAPLGGYVNHNCFVLTRDTHQCMKFLAQPHSLSGARTRMLEWEWDFMGDLTAVFAIKHTPVELHSERVHMGRQLTTTGDTRNL